MPPTCIFTLQPPCIIHIIHVYTHIYMYIGLLWTKQFFHYVMDTWVEGDPKQLPPPESRKWGRNAKDWEHLYNRDVISMPDKWEYPWVIMGARNEGSTLG